MFGGSGHDILDSVDGETDRVFGDAGNDTLYVDYFRDYFEGGSGVDYFFDEFDHPF
jgi:hypothetical protein